jgi:hypothetical protein
MAVKRGPRRLMLLLAVTALLTAGCTASLAAPAQPGPRPTAAGVPTAAPATALCRAIPALDQMAVHRRNGLVAGHLRFSFPAQLTVSNPPSVRMVARSLCALPPDTLTNCPADFGVRYQLTFRSAGQRFGPVTADPAGCETVTGLGRTARFAAARFWRALARSLGLGRHGANIATLFQPRPPV